MLTGRHGFSITDDTPFEHRAMPDTSANTEDAAVKFCIGFNVHVLHEQRTRHLCSIVDHHTGVKVVGRRITEE